MPESNDFMLRAQAEPDAASSSFDVPTDQPSPARSYGLHLGSKDNYEADRQAIGGLLERFPEGVDVARQNRRFLYRAVRYLAREEGIDQFLDLGSGLPTENNVHQVVREFRPGSRVVYVDIDPVVMVHGRALMVEDTSTGFVHADLTDPESVLNAPQTRELIDFSRPVAVLLFSIPHCIPDDEAAYRAVRGCLEPAVSGSFLALSHACADTPEAVEEADRLIGGTGLPWKTRPPAEVDALVEGLEPVEPGLGDIDAWRPDPDQPPLSPPHPLVEPYVGSSKLRRRIYEYGGVLRKP
ncbi:SAM-dependent methyltransferase [Streptomonospora litoralis]|uniref:S-adenosyl methyltransferase n=1 Tax=Streptomonospora litoralis TaxID=2498135 RepID=A0A4V0ZKC4_9ACTN|nr:SAM-dependent methyltransferase [Streptomonospora litoralis]QBI56492.1 S-adenosyl methyltransferase [Streptomonospora litoralis]